MDNAALESVPALDIKTLLARINERIALLRVWISHAHNDEPYWWARQTTAPVAQSERHALRGLANLLHVERATARGRIHGTRFPTLDDQRAWLRQYETHALAAAGIPSGATLVLLREGKLKL